MIGVEQNPCATAYRIAQAILPPPQEKSTSAQQSLLFSLSRCAGLVESGIFKHIACCSKRKQEPCALLKTNRFYLAPAFVNCSPLFQICSVLQHGEETHVKLGPFKFIGKMLSFLELLESPPPLLTLRHRGCPHFLPFSGLFFYVSSDQSKLYRQHFLLCVPGLPHALSHY